MKLFYSSSKIKKSIAFTAFCLSCALNLFSQGLVPATDFFKDISTYYGSLKDYEADADIKMGNTEMKAHIIYLQPDKMRMDFSNPPNQTIVFNGQTLTVYLPDSAAVLTQNASGTDTDTAATIATAEGLSLLRRYYSISYEIGQEPVPLTEGSDEMVVKLVLWRRNTSEEFRYIKIAVDPETKLIRRIEAVTASTGVTYIFEFSNYETNQGITEQRFVFDMPPAANIYDNFLFAE